jgi:AcrR family transcriptional regulator
MAGYLLVSNMSTPKTQIRTESPFAEASACDAASCARDRIFEAAKKLFYKFGVRGVSVDQIAAEADTTKVTLYRVFDSKDDLLVKVLEDQSQHVWTWWDSVVAQHEGNPREQLEALFSEMRECIAEDDAERGCLLCNVAVEVVEEGHPAREVIRKYKAELGTRLRALCREMGARQPDMLGDSLSLLLNGIFSARLGAADLAQVGSVFEAAKALIDSPSLGIGPTTKRA